MGSAVGPATSLAALNIPYLELILDEIFAVPPPWLNLAGPPPPQTVGELAAASGLALAVVCNRLAEVQRMSAAIEITGVALQRLLNETGDGPRTEGAPSNTASPAGDRLLLLDVRQPWEFAIGHLPGSVLLAETDFTALLPRLRASALVVTICHHGVRSFSAAMALRQQGVASATSLAGGLDAWATSVDLSFPRY